MAITRPLTGEPLPLDLLNTTWMEQGARRDMFDTPGALGDWLAAHDLPQDAPDAETTAFLVEAREAIRAVVSGAEGAEAAINAVLAHGVRRLRLVDGRPTITYEVDDPARFPGWRAAATLLDLLDTRPDRIRKCANPNCILWYLDTTRNGSRRWHSMETCGNRAKAKRFQDRHA
ncbi:CGNR zinc finger domain-containing protein [Glycomyces sp. NPDC048151]|uniref:CGNR zinc finger domain-containing protein n=1 Tax=Glycomyces sp. NPDC048151 TaxID=3364002 RepID=UPI00370FDC9B